MRLLLPAAILISLVLAGACGDDDTTASPSVSRSATPTASRTPVGSPSPTATLAPTATKTPPPTERPAQPIPGGFPIDPNTHLGVVVGAVGSRALLFDQDGPLAFQYARDDQPSGDPARANRSGWNCDVHYEYESAPAVDFYIPLDTPILATMDGTATLYAISDGNDFSRYDIDPEPYIGNPDRSRAPYSPFPGPSSGLGVYVHIENSEYVTEYGHLNIATTTDVIPSTAFVGDWSPDTIWGMYFRDVPDPPVATEIAQWEVQQGDVIGMSGNSGYSEGLHIHYTVAQVGGPLHCPTTEAGYTDGGWLFR